MKSNQWLSSPRRNKQESILALAKKYVFENMVKTITAAGSFFGGLLILIYLLDEKYFPTNIDISSIGVLLAAAALVGVVVSILFGLYFIIPGYAYRNISAEELKKNSMDISENIKIFLLLDVPGLFAAVFIVIYLVTHQFPITLHFFSWTGYLLILVLISPLCTYPRISGTTKEVNELWGRLFIVFLSSFVLALVPWVLILQFAIAYSRNDSDDMHVWSVILMMTCAVVVSNHIVVVAKKWWWILIVAIVALFSIVAISWQWSLIPRGVVRVLNIGNISNASLLLDEQGCEVVARYTTDHPVELPHKKMASCKLSSVTISWRVGNEYWIKSQEEKKDTHGRSVLGFVFVDEADKATCPEIALAGKHHACESHSNMADESKEKSLLFNSVVRFSLPAAHVLSWAIEVPK